MRGLTDKRIIVTGGCGSIGSAVARRFIEEGSIVVLADLLPTNEGERLVREIDTGRAFYVRCDICDTNSIAEALIRTDELIGGLDVVVSNAGIHDNDEVPDMSEQQWQRVLDVNLTANYRFGRAAAERLTQNPLPTNDQGLRGVVLFTSSVAAFKPGVPCVNYSAAKAGLHSVMRTLAAAYAPQRISCNAVAPGTVESRLQQENEARYENYRENVIRDTPFGRFVTPEEVAGCYAYLASEDATYITGTTLFIDGGVML